MVPAAVPQSGCTTTASGGGAFASVMLAARPLDCTGVVRVIGSSVPGGLRSAMCSGGMDASAGCEASAPYGCPDEIASWLRVALELSGIGDGA